MEETRTRKIIFTALCIAIGLILPRMVNMIPIAYPGAVLLPMHIPVLVCGYLCGWRYGLVSGLILPLLASALTTMPPIFPTAVSMSLELAAYGFLTGWLYQITKGRIFVSLIGAMLGGRLVMGIANILLYSVGDNPYGLGLFISGAFVTALPGIIIQLIIIPILIQSFKHARLMA